MEVVGVGRGGASQEWWSVNCGDRRWNDSRLVPDKTGMFVEERTRQQICE